MAHTDGLKKPYADPNCLNCHYKGTIISNKSGEVIRFHCYLIDAQFISFGKCLKWEPIRYVAKEDTMNGTMMQKMDDAKKEHEPVKKSCRECKWVKNINESGGFDCVEPGDPYNFISSVDNISPKCFTPKENTMPTLMKDGKTYGLGDQPWTRANIYRRIGSKFDNEINTVFDEFSGQVDDYVSGHDFRYNYVLEEALCFISQKPSCWIEALVKAGFLVEVEEETFKVGDWIEFGGSKFRIVFGLGDKCCHLFNEVPGSYITGTLNPVHYGKITKKEMDYMIGGDGWKKIDPPQITFPDDEKDCPDCLHRGYNFGIAAEGPGHSLQGGTKLYCETCKGSGKVAKS